MRGIAAFAFSCVALAAEGLAANKSVFTDINAATCQPNTKKLPEQPTEYRCVGVGGYALLVEEFDSRALVKVRSPDGKKHDLRFEQLVTSAFTSLGPKAEWRVWRNGRLPFALIVHLNAQKDIGTETKNESYYIVIKLRPRRVCVTARIDAQKNGRSKAIHAADFVHKAACAKVASNGAPVN